MSKKMHTRCRGLDRISSLPQNINGNILSLMPIRDALRTSILSKKWRYAWRSMPKLVFTDNMVKLPPSDHCSKLLKKYKLVNAIFHVLLLHNGPMILEFNCSVGELGMVSEFDQIIGYLGKGNTVKRLIFGIDKCFYKLPGSFFLLQGLEHIQLQNCVFEPPFTFSGCSTLKTMAFTCVDVSPQMLERFVSKCPLLHNIYMSEDVEGFVLSEGGTKFTFVDLFRCAPLIRVLDITKAYMKYLGAGGMPHKLPTSLVHLEYLFLDVCFMEQNEISSALCIIRSSPMLVKIMIHLYDEELHVQQTPTNFLNTEDNSDFKLDDLETLEIENFSNLPLEMEFVKLIMAKSPELEKVQITLDDEVSVDEELKMLKDMVLLPFPRASPSAKIIIKRRQTSI